MTPERWLVGRKSELRVLGDLLTGVRHGPAAAWIHGPPGIGKSALISHTVERAVGAGFDVISTQPVESELSLAFSGLADLFSDSFPGIAVVLSEDRRHAMAVALRLTNPGARPDPLTVAQGVRDALVALAHPRPLVLVIDDVQWLDQPSALALEYAFRRLEGSPVALLVGQRDPASSWPLSLDRWPARGRVKELGLAPLDPPDIRRVVTRTVAAGLPRSLLSRVAEASAGNPLHATELARAWSTRRSWGEFSVQADQPLATLLSTRLEQLPRRLLPFLQLVAVADEPTVGVLEALAEDTSGSLRDCEDAEAIVVVRDRVRFTHPLLRSAVYESLPRAQRGRMHATVAAYVSDPETKARHLALSSDVPDLGLCLPIAKGASEARRRGAPGLAAELYEHAVRLTPRDNGEVRNDLLIELTECLAAANEVDRAVRLLDELLSTGLEPAQRSEAALLRAMLDTDASIALDRLDRAARDVPPDSSEAVRILATSAWYAGLWAGDLVRGEQVAERALAASEACGDVTATVMALTSAGMIRVVRGRVGGTALLSRAAALEPGAVSRLDLKRPTIALANAWTWEGRFQEARMLLSEPVTQEYEELQRERFLTELEIRAGRLDAARGHLDNAEMFDPVGYWASQLAWLRGYVQSLEGDVDSARIHLLEAASFAEAHEDISVRMQVGYVRGLLELSVADPEAALVAMQGLVPALDRWGVGEPAQFPLRPYLVEALVAVGRVNEAEKQWRAIASQAKTLRHPWGLAASDLSLGELQLVRGDPSRAAQTLGAAADKFGETFPIDSARATLAQGRALARAGQRRDAAAAFATAQQAFTVLGCRRWAASSEAAGRRISGRRGGGSELTSTERHVAALVGQGLSNQQIAMRLSVQRTTVEAHLTRAYRKLGIGSRSELTRLVTQGDQRVT